MKLFFTLFLFSFFIPPAFAEEVLDIPIVSSSTIQEANTTHPTLHLGQDKSELITLNKDAASVIVGNPNHISVLLDTPQTLVVVPRQAGASHFTVIAQDGSTLMQRHVVVGGPKENYIRIRRSCAANDRNCEQVSTYFCPDVCHEITESNDTTARQ